MAGIILQLFDSSGRTYLGFLSIALNDIQLLYQFGLVASTGLLFNFVITVALVPVMLRWLGHRASAGTARGQVQAWFQRWAVGLLQAAQRHRLKVLITAGMLAVAAILAATQLRSFRSKTRYTPAEPPRPRRSHTT